MQQVARNLTDAEGGTLLGQQHLLRDRDTKFGAGFRSILRDGDLEPLRLPQNSSDLNAFAERWVLSLQRIHIIRNRWCFRSRSSDNT